jgi:aspartate 1-decarboxylase
MNHVRASNIIEGEKEVSIVNINNGERFETYAIKGEKKKLIHYNGPCCREGYKDDIIIIIFVCGHMDFEEKHSNHGLFSL